jgi:hypothetical protein
VGSDDKVITARLCLGDLWTCTWSDIFPIVLSADTWSWKQVTIGWIFRNTDFAIFCGTSHYMVSISLPSLFTIVFS